MVVLPCWISIAAAPKWRWSQRLATFVAPLPIACLYAWLLPAQPTPKGAGFNSLALHALQIFPLAGMALARTRWRDGLQVLLLLVFAAICSGGVWWRFAEAMQGAPVISATYPLQAGSAECSS